MGEKRDLLSFVLIFGGLFRKKMWICELCLKIGKGEGVVGESHFGCLHELGLDNVLPWIIDGISMSRALKEDLLGF